MILQFFSKSDQDHLKHLRQNFIKCKKYVLSLNPKKYHFSMEEGNLLGHIVSKDGVKIDPQCIEASSGFRWRGFSGQEEARFSIHRSISC